jgi:hypothetical protein
VRWISESWEPDCKSVSICWEECIVLQGGPSIFLLKSIRVPNVRHVKKANRKVVNMAFLKGSDRNRYSNEQEFS